MNLIAYPHIYAQRRTQKQYIQTCAHRSAQNHTVSFGNMHNVMLFMDDVKGMFPKTPTLLNISIFQMSLLLLEWYFLVLYNTLIDRLVSYHVNIKGSIIILSGRNNALKSAFYCNILLCRLMVKDQIIDI